ncbi:hypothetical protein EDC39_10399 [Geothermobacter ehrlichii]|uniref:DUF3887 domain-containing protein n=1 Tax=Geothermobacter ehrlichii TaxID=213224 RepID=A0A5D3WME6_9BACT|nr:hypothetical protein [Geothermobacter ehrlichii]TYO99256.1 hypothetical protein EDC39_10399 [Geothermobacter ehrlichii]
MYRSTVAFLMCCSILLAGCAGLGDFSGAGKGQSAFGLLSDDFVQRLRWQDYVGAAVHLTEPNRQDFLDRFQKDRDLKITDVRLESLVFTKQGTLADGELIVEYYRLPSLTVKTARFPVRWRFYGPDDPTPVGWKITLLSPHLP